MIGHFAPQHVVGGEGAATWSEPDPGTGGDGHLAPALPVEVIAEATGWAQVRCGNGYETWLDARALVSVPEPPATAPPTHRVGAATAPARPRPETGDPPDNQLESGLEVVELLRWGAWVHVRCSNGWQTWVEAPSLVPLRGTGADGAPGAGIWVPIIGAALTVLGSFLPWFSARGSSASAWDLPWVGLATEDATDVMVDAGPLLLVVLVLVLPLLTRRALPAWVIVLTGLFATLTAALGFRFYFDLPDPRPDLGVGLVITVVGGLVVLAGAAVPRGSR